MSEITARLFGAAFFVGRVGPAVGAGAAAAFFFAAAEAARAASSARDDDATPTTGPLHFFLLPRQLRHLCSPKATRHSWKPRAMHVSH